MTKYIHLEWPDSQEYMEKDDCFTGMDNDCFVPETYFEEN